MPDAQVDVKKNAMTLKLLADETRLTIIQILGQQGETNVTDLCEKVGQSQPAVSHHLALLRTAGLLESRREGKHNFYSITRQAFENFEEIKKVLPSNGKQVSETAIEK